MVAHEEEWRGYTELLIYSRWKKRETAVARAVQLGAAGNSQRCSPKWILKYITKQKKTDMFLIETKFAVLLPLP